LQLFYFVLFCGELVKNFPLSLTTKRDFDNQVNKLLSENPSQKLFVNISPKPKKRSLPANAVYYAWIPDISDHTGMYQIEVRNTLKLDFGLNIVLSDKEKGPPLYKMLNRLNFYNLTRPELIGYMDSNQWVQGAMEFLNVTSLMSTKQHNRMRDEILYFYQQMGVNIDYKKIKSP